MNGFLKTLIGAACVVIIAAGAAKAYGAYSQARDIAERDSALRYELTVYAQERTPEAYCGTIPEVLASTGLDEKFRPTVVRLERICQHFGYL